MNDYVEIADYNGEGFSPVWYCGAWRIAVSCHSEETEKKNITTISKHLKTDETFTLIYGKAQLYYGNGTDTPGTISSIELEVGKTAVVKAGTWHFTVIAPGTKILIAENADTGAENTVKLPVRQEDIP